MNAKKLTNLTLALYLIGTTLLWIFGDKSDINHMGKMFVFITYIASLIIMLIFKFTNGEGYNFKRSGFINPIDRAKIYRTATPIVSVLIIIGLFLSTFLYKSFNYMYDFITLIIILVLSWNVVAILGDRIDQLNEKRK